MIIVLSDATEAQRWLIVFGGLLIIVMWAWCLGPATFNAVLEWWKHRR